MASARHVLEKLRSSDGRIRVKTLSGVSALVAVIALLVGVLPAMAHDFGTDTHDVHPVVVAYGGGSGACSATIEGRLPSAASKEFHINNPQAGMSYTQDGITVTVRDRTDKPAGRVFDFTVAADSDFVVYDVIVNGGSQNNHYDYDGNGGPGTVKDDKTLHAPRKNANSLFNLSHVNICYDVPGITFFACDDTVTLTDDGLFTVAEATIFANFVHDECTGKRGSFLIDNEADPPNVTLAFQGDGTAIAAGRLDVTKDFFENPFQGPEDFEDLEYRRTEQDPYVDVSWCAVRDKAVGDGTEFNDVLAADEYPSLLGVTDDGGDAISCKVYEEEDATGIQYTVVYFELEDPQWR